MTKNAKYPAVDAQSIANAANAYFNGRSSSGSSMAKILKSSKTTKDYQVVKSEVDRLNDFLDAEELHQPRQRG
jgi:peptide methionine sulfoxide reductase MsrA